MPRHEYFEELCALAVHGELSAAELAEFNEHLQECRVCQTAYSQFRALASEHMALSHRPRRTEAGSIRADRAQQLREATLERIVGEGLRISPDAMRGGKAPGKVRLLGLFERWPQFVTAAALLVLLASVSLLLRRDLFLRKELDQLRVALNQSRDRIALLSQVPLVKESAGTPPVAPPPPAAKPDPDTTGLQRQLVDAKEVAQHLTSEHQRDAETVRTLEARVAQLTAEKTALGQRAAAADTDLGSLKARLEQLRGVAADRDGKLAALQTRITELTEEAAGQRAALDRERDFLAAGRDVRDLMAARNLHIIDVHDQDARGVSRPFGRIFLTEGKRLIFYAYDLDTVRVKDASFQAWGQRENRGKSAVNLGIFYVDDQKQSRWLLKVEDPGLLNIIDSVFVTVEPAGGAKKPTGKKLMYAYLRNPINHP